MNKKKLFFVFAFLLVVILLVSLSSAVYRSSSPKYIYGGITSAFGTNPAAEFDPRMCQEGQDFIVQIDPAGCTPAVVRSDLLEEQDVPVFCPLQAIKINPLVDVDIIHSMTFGGEVPQEVRSVGFHPAKSALSSRDNIIENPTYDNIGYAVIILKNQPNESAMPEFVEGNLSARIRYDVENAFGIRRNNFYLPIMEEDEWNKKMVRYSFWDGRGYLRAEDVQGDSATIAVYSDVYRTPFEGSIDNKRKFGTMNLRKGETSDVMFLPGFYCFAGLKLRLDGVEYADTRALLRINSEYVEIKEGEKFLNNKCYIKKGSIEESGINKQIEVYCQEDEGGIMGGDAFGLNIAPRIKIEINEGGEKTIMNASVGDVLYSTSASEMVYLGYAKMLEGGDKKENLRIYLLAKPCGERGENCGLTLNNDEITAEATLAESFEYEGIKEGSLTHALGEFLSAAYARAAKTVEWLYQGGRHSIVDYGEETTFKEAKITLLGFSKGHDMEINEQALDYYDLAQENYKIVSGDFVGFSYPENVSITLDEEALLSNILVSDYLDQSTEVKKLCLEYQNKFPTTGRLPTQCKAITGLSEIGSKVEKVLIDGNVKEISLVDVYEMNYEDYGVELQITSPDKITKTFYLERDKTIYLDSLSKTSSETFIVFQNLNSNSDSFRNVYFRYSHENEAWKWSPDMGVWFDTRTTTVIGSSVRDYNNKDPEKKIVKLIKALENGGEKLDYYKGKALFPKGTTEDKGNFVRLTNIKSPSEAKFQIRAPKEFMESVEDLFLNDERSLKKGFPQTFDTQYTFVIKNINLKEYAKVSVIPEINYQKTDADFKFKVFIEKRAIQLSPEKIKSKVEKLNKTIEDWQKISDGLGDVVKTMKTACVGVSAVLTVKNLFENSGGKSMARTEVMKGDEGWAEKCTDLVNVDGSDFKSVDDCYLHHSKEIEEDVNFLHKKLKSQNDNIESIQERCMNKNKFLESKSVDTDCLVGNLSKEVVKKISEPNLKNPGNEEEELDLSYIKKTLDKEGWGNHTYNMDQLKDIDLYYDLWKSAKDDEDKTRYKQKLYNVLDQVNKNSIEFEEIQESIQTAKKNIKLDGSIGAVPLGKEKKEIAVYQGRKTISTWELNSSVKQGSPIQLVRYDGESYYVVLKDLKTENKYDFKKDKDENYMIYDLNGNIVDKETMVAIESSVRHFEKYDKTTYQNKYLNPELRYYDTEPYSGEPALVPVDLVEGWYVYIRQTLGVGGNIGSYDLSGIPNSFVLCNVGQNGFAEYPKSNIDDICEIINTKTGQAYNQFPGLDRKDSAKVIDRAVDAIEKAQNIRNKKIGEFVYLLDGQSVRIGTPATEVPLTQCADFMSVKDCQLLFNVCDPVVCPSSRCNFGGRYYVKDVIQSGIIGSLVLCLPNFNEGVYIPVCLSGVKAGMDGWLSVSRAYKDCLQQNLETGETVGICDEMNSIYMCEFFWRQALPITKLLFPKLLEFVTGESTTRGGGEYMFVDSALDTAESSIDYLTQNYALNAYQAFKFRNSEQVGSAVCKNFISLTYPGGVDILDTLTEPDSPFQFTGKFDEIPFSTATYPAISHYKVYYHIYSGNDRGAYFRVYLRGGSENLYYEDDFLGRTVNSGYIAKGEYASETADLTAPSGMKELCINVNGQEECGFGQVTTNFAMDWVKDQYIAGQATDRGIITEKACISGTADWYSMLNPNLQEGLGDLIDPQIYNRGIIRICATKNPGNGSDVFVGQEKQRWIDVGYCSDKEMRCWLDTNSIKDAVEFSYTEETILEEMGEELVKQLLNSTEHNYLKDGGFEKEIKKIEDEKDPEKKLELIDAIFNRVFYLNEKGYLYFLKGEIYRDLAERAFKKKSGELVAENCEDKPRTILLAFLSDLEGTSATRADDVEGGVIPDCDESGGDINCYDVARYAYDKKNLGLKCVYSDKENKEYVLKMANGNINSINTSKNTADTLFVNTKSCDDVNLDEGKKLALLKKGDMVSYYWGYSEHRGRDLSHNAIFIEWVDFAKRKAKMFDGNLGAEGSEKFRFYEVDLSDSEHPVVMFWKPYLRNPEDIEGCGCVSDKGEKGFCTYTNNELCQTFVSNKCPGDENIRCCIEKVEVKEKEDKEAQEISFVVEAIEEALKDGGDKGIFNLDLDNSPVFKIKDFTYGVGGTMWIKFEDREWYWSKDYESIGDWEDARSAWTGSKVDWIDIGETYNPYGEETREVEKALIVGLRGKSLQQGVELLITETKNEDRQSMFSSPYLQTYSTTYEDGVFEVDLIDLKLDFEYFESKGWYVNLKDVKKDASYAGYIASGKLDDSYAEEAKAYEEGEAFSVNGISEKQLEKFLNIEKSIIKALKGQDFFTGAYILFLVSLSDYGSEGISVQDPFSGDKVTCWDLEKAMVKSVGKYGKYSDGRESKIFIDQLCHEACKNTLISKDDCEDLRGEGSWIGARWWNVEESMSFVKSILADRRKGEVGKWDDLSAYVKTDSFEEGGWLDYAYTYDGRKRIYADAVRMWQEDGLIDAKFYKSLKSNPSDNLKPTLMNHFKSKINFEDLKIVVSQEELVDYIKDLLSGIDSSQLDNAHPDLLGFMWCLDKEYSDLSGEHLAVTSITDDDLYGRSPRCDLSYEDESFSDDFNCVHKQDSCHYYPFGRSQDITNDKVQSLAMDLRKRGVDLNEFEEALEKCASHKPKEYSGGKTIKYDENKKYYDEDDHLHLALQKCFRDPEAVIYSGGVPNYAIRFKDYIKDKGGVVSFKDYSGRPIIIVDGINQEMYAQYISYENNKLFLKEQIFEGAMFQISTSKVGFGFEVGSDRTPTGIFKINRKVGAGEDYATVFVNQQSTGETTEIFKDKTNTEEDFITTRVLVLEGLEDKNENTLSRNIYIHGTNEEGFLGTPASHGCIRMNNNEIVKLFEEVEKDDLVVILA